MSEKRLKAFMHGLNSLRSIATKVGLFLAVGSPNANNCGFVHLTEMLILGVKWMRLGENHINSCSPPSAKAQNMTPRIESCDLTLTFTVDCPEPLRQEETWSRCGRWILCVYNSLM